MLTAKINNIRADLPGIFNRAIAYAENEPTISENIVVAPATITEFRMLSPKGLSVKTFL
jgi:hypothetical protein